MTDFSALTERQRAVWSAGDWPAVAPKIAEASRVVVEHLGVSSGHDYLDVATGSGTAALLGARRGARATGLDFVPALIEAARARAAEEGIDVDWVVGDAQDLPFEDDRFDRVSSIFGAMFAPDQERAAAELVRVCRPGGTIAVAAWTPEGMNGQMFATLGKLLPPPPEGFKPPILWGTEERVQELFAGQDVRTERRLLRFEDPSLDVTMTELSTQLGPIVMAKQVLEPEGRWPEAERELRGLYQRFNQAGDGSVRADAEYLLTTVTVR